jgi:hypothetical protein
VWHAAVSAGRRALLVPSSPPPLRHAPGPSLEPASAESRRACVAQSRSLFCVPVGRVAVILQIRGVTLMISDARSPRRRGPRAAAPRARDRRLPPTPRLMLTLMPTPAYPYALMPVNASAPCSPRPAKFAASARAPRPRPALPFARSSRVAFLNAFRVLGVSRLFVLARVPRRRGNAMRRGPRSSTTRVLDGGMAYARRVVSNSRPRRAAHARRFSYPLSFVIATIHCILKRTVRWCASSEPPARRGKM